MGLLPLSPECIGHNISNVFDQSEDELWQWSTDGSSMTIETGSGNFNDPNPSSGTGWFDFRVVADFNTNQILSASYRHENDGSFTQLLPGAVSMKGGGDATTARRWRFRANDQTGGTSADLAWDDLRVVPIPEPGTLSLLALGAGSLLFRRRK